MIRPWQCLAWHCPSLVAVHPPHLAASFRGRYAAKWGVDMSRVTPSPACSAYVDFLSDVAASASTSVAACAAAMVPCMRLYAHLGQQLKPVAASDSAYLEWIDAYASSEFEEAAAAAETLLDTFGGDESGGGLSGEEADAYHAAMRLEVAFFDQVWRALPLPSLGV